MQKDCSSNLGKSQEEIIDSITEKKRANMRLSGSFKRIGLNSRSERSHFCGTRLHFRKCENGHRVLVDANFCKDRLCPMCSWRRSRKLTKEILEILHVALERHKLRFLFLTLTVKNVPGEELPDMLTQMFQGFRNMMLHKEIDRYLVGWIRNLEITVKDGSYHPHFHCLIAVKPSYFKDGYISQKRWTEHWRHCAKLDYTPVVHIEAVKPKKREGEIADGIAETAKYAVKDSDYIKPTDKETDEIVGVLSGALRSRRLIGFGKEFRKIRAELKHKDDDLNDSTDPQECSNGSCPICESTLQDMLYEWRFDIAEYVPINQ